MCDPPKKPGPGWSQLFTIGDRDWGLATVGDRDRGHHRRPGPGTGHRPVTGFWFFVKIPSVTLTDSETEDDGWEQGSRDKVQSEDGTDDVQEVEASGSRDSAKPILRFPERNDEYTFWTHTDETKPDSVKNRPKMIPLLLWTTDGGTTSKLTDGSSLPESSHREASVRPSTNGCS